MDDKERWVKEKKCLDCGSDDVKYPVAIYCPDCLLKRLQKK